MIFYCVDRLAAEKPDILTGLPRNISGTITGDSIMKRIPLTQGKFAIVDDDMFEYLNQWNWWADKGRNTYYAARHEGNKKIYMHRFIMKAKNRRIFIDHINDNGLDNRKCNLRLCNAAQNIVNSRGRKNRSSQYKGVSWCKSINKWEAFITVDYKKTGLGYFIVEEKAARARDKAVLKQYGEFARLNNV